MAIWSTVDEFAVQGHKDSTSQVHIQEYTSGWFRAIFMGMNGLETTVEFDEVVCNRNTIEFYRTVGKRRIKTGDIEENSAQMAKFFKNQVTRSQIASPQR